MWNSWQDTPQKWSYIPPAIDAINSGPNIQSDADNGPVDWATLAQQWMKDKSSIPVVEPPPPPPLNPVRPPPVVHLPIHHPNVQLQGISGPIEHSSGIAPPHVYGSNVAGFAGNSDSTVRLQDQFYENAGAMYPNDQMVSYGFDGTTESYQDCSAFQAGNFDQYFNQTGIASPGADLKSFNSKRKSLPGWLRQALEDREMKRRKDEAKEIHEERMKFIREKNRKKMENKWESDSDIEEVDMEDNEGDKVSQPQEPAKDDSPTADSSPVAESDAESLTEEERLEILTTTTRRLMTDILLSVTTEMVQTTVSQVYSKLKGLASYGAGSDDAVVSSEAEDDVGGTTDDEAEAQLKRESYESRLVFGNSQHRTGEQSVSKDAKQDPIVTPPRTQQKLSSSVSSSISDSSSTSSSSSSEGSSTGNGSNSKKTGKVDPIIQRRGLSGAKRVSSEQLSSSDSESSDSPPRPRRKKPEESGRIKSKRKSKSRRSRGSDSDEVVPSRKRNYEARLRMSESGSSSSEDSVTVDRRRSGAKHRRSRKSDRSRRSVSNPCSRKRGSVRTNSDGSRHRRKYSRSRSRRSRAVGRSRSRDRRERARSRSRSRRRDTSSRKRR